MEQGLLIVWRESVEALLVIGILFAWLRQQPGRRHAMAYLWGGVGLGLLLAGLLAGLMALAGNWMNGPAGEWFQAGLSLVASLLILQMACWMARHGGQLRQQLQRDAGASVNQPGRARGALLGLLRGLPCFPLLQPGSRFIAWRQFFLISEWLLILLGGALLISALDRASGQLMALELPEQLYTLIGTPLWDSSALLDDGSRIGTLLASLTGYRAMPSTLQALLLGGYWLLSWRLLRKPAPLLRSSLA